MGRGAAAALLLLWLAAVDLCDGFFLHSGVGPAAFSLTIAGAAGKARAAIHRASASRTRRAHSLERGDFVDISPNQDGSILKKIVQAGSYKVGCPRQFDEVEISWKMFLPNNTLVHDSAEIEDEKNGYFRFKVGMEPSETIEGWEQALNTMYQGEIANLVIAPQHAFGSKGLPGFVDPNATLVCELHLRSIHPFITREYEIESEDRKEQVYDDILRKLHSGDLPLPSQTVPHPSFPGEGIPSPDIQSQSPSSASKVKFFDPSKHRVDPNLVVGGEGRDHTWKEMFSTIEVRVPLPASVRSKQDLSVSISSRALSIHTLQNGSQVSLLEGPLAGKILPSESSWAVESVLSEQTGTPRQELWLCLEKAHSSRDIWASVFDRDFLRKQSPSATLDEQ